MAACGVWHGRLQNMAHLVSAKSMVKGSGIPSAVCAELCNVAGIQPLFKARCMAPGEQESSLRRSLVPAAAVKLAPRLLCRENEARGLPEGVRHGTTYAHTTLIFSEWTLLQHSSHHLLYSLLMGPDGDCVDETVWTRQMWLVARIAGLMVPEKLDNALILCKVTKGAADLRAESLAGSPLQSHVIPMERAAGVSKGGCQDWRLCYILRLSSSVTYINGGEYSSPLHITSHLWNNSC